LLATVFPLIFKDYFKCTRQVIRGGEKSCDLTPGLFLKKDTKRTQSRNEYFREHRHCCRSRRVLQQHWRLPLFFKKKRKLFLEFKIMFQSSFVDLDEPKSAFPLCLELVEGPLPPSFWLQIINCIPFRLFF